MYERKLRRQNTACKLGFSPFLPLPSKKRGGESSGHEVWESNRFAYVTNRSLPFLFFCFFLAASPRLPPFFITPSSFEGRPTRKEHGTYKPRRFPPDIRTSDVCFPLLLFCLFCCPFPSPRLSGVHVRNVEVGETA